MSEKTEKKKKVKNKKLTLTQLAEAVGDEDNLMEFTIYIHNAGYQDVYEKETFKARKGDKLKPFITLEEYKKSKKEWIGR